MNSKVVINAAANILRGCNGGFLSAKLHSEH
jgi:hypothetical protein